MYGENYHLLDLDLLWHLSGVDMEYITWVWFFFVIDVVCWLAYDLVYFDSVIGMVHIDNVWQIVIVSFCMLVYINFLHYVDMFLPRPDKLGLLEIN